MNKPNEAVKILKEEYGIATMRELEAAIKKLGFLDISLFCSETKSQKCYEEEMV